MTHPTPVGRERPRARRALLALTTALAGMAATTPAAAQLTAPAPVRQSVDGNGVDLFAGTMNVDAPALSVGQDQGLSYYRLNRGAGWTDNLTATMNLNGSTLTVSFGGGSDSFTVSNGVYTPTEKNGATLTFNNSTSIYTYTRADGTVMRFYKNWGSPAPYYAGEGRVIDITQPSGDKLTYAYDAINYCSSFELSGGGPTCIQQATAFRIASVRSSYGYKLVFGYAPIGAYDPEDVNNQPDLTTWSTVTSASVRNLATSPGTSLASESFGVTSSGISVTDPVGRVTSYRLDSSGVVLGVTKPGSSAEDVTVAYTYGRVTGVTTPAGTTSYASVDSAAANERTVTVTDPLQHATVYAFDLSSSRMKRMTRTIGGVGRTFSWAYDANGRMTDATAPEGNHTHLTYDDRGNVTERREVAKAGSGLADIVTSATYPAACVNVKTCNQPVTTTDAHGQVTNYAYDSNHGGVTSMTLPAASASVARAETRYGYSTLQAYFDTGAGAGVVASGEPVVRLTSTSTCRAGATPSCLGTADETVQAVDYGPQAVGTGNNLLPVARTVRAGDASVAATTTMTYDAQGNPSAVDGPLPGTGDTTRTAYNATRELGIVDKG